MTESEAVSLASSSSTERSDEKLSLRLAWEARSCKRVWARWMKAFSHAKAASLHPQAVLLNFSKSYASGGSWPSLTWCTSVELSAGQKTVTEQTTEDCLMLQAAQLKIDADSFLHSTALQIDRFKYRGYLSCRCKLSASNLLLSCTLRGFEGNCRQREHQYHPPGFEGLSLADDRSHLLGTPMHC